jgi:phosphoglycolate phosphatase
MTLPKIIHCSLFLFDLDGTLIDSRTDITASVNRALIQMRLNPLHEARIANMVGFGMRKLVESALQAATEREPEEPLLQEGLARFMDEYSKHLLDHTQLLPAVKEGLECLSWADFAVVTNKPEAFSKQILEGLGISRSFKCIIGGDSVQNRKPHPEPLIKAMEFCNKPPSLSAMVGDSAVDIEAGKAAKAATCGVLGGFRPREELEAAGCDVIAANLLEMPRFFHPPLI